MKLSNYGNFLLIKINMINIKQNNIINNRLNKDILMSYGVFESNNTCNNKKERHDFFNNNV